jgi:glycosyltransferase involved in cell wall biosynthesis
VRAGTSDDHLSVVIATHNAHAVIATCLDALARQEPRPARLQIIVSDSSEDGTDQLVRAHYPEIELLHFEAALTLPELRGRAIARATGHVVAILDPYSVAAPDWASAVLSAHARYDAPVIGGTVDLYQPEQRGWLEWTTYFNEYGLFMSPTICGAVDIVPGSNVSYKRAALFDGPRPRYPVFWKTFANQELAARGVPLWLAPDIRVALNKPIRFSEFLRSRYHHGRCYAAMRVEQAGTTMRWARGLSAPLVAPVLLARWTLGFWPKRARRLRWLATMPAQLLLFGSWAYGELCGYLAGSGGACRKLFY